MDLFFPPVKIFIDYYDQNNYFYTAHAVNVVIWLMSWTFCPPGGKLILPQSRKAGKSFPVRNDCMRLANYHIDNLNFLRTLRPLLGGRKNYFAVTSIRQCGNAVLGPWNQNLPIPFWFCHIVAMCTVKTAFPCKNDDVFTPSLPCDHQNKEDTPSTRHCVTSLILDDPPNVLTPPAGARRYCSSAGR